MSVLKTCSECGQPVPGDSPGGYCAQCLLNLGLDKSAESKAQIAESATPQSEQLPNKDPIGRASISRTVELAPTAVMAIPLTEKAGDRISRYRLLQEIGQGGCGVV